MTRLMTQSMSNCLTLIENGVIIEIEWNSSPNTADHYNISFWKGYTDQLTIQPLKEVRNYQNLQQNFVSSIDHKSKNFLYYMYIFVLFN